jgi:hypothetical protein
MHKFISSLLQTTSYDLEGTYCRMNWCTEPHLLLITLAKPCSTALFLNGG